MSPAFASSITFHSMYLSYPVYDDPKSSENSFLASAVGNPKLNFIGHASTIVCFSFITSPAAIPASTNFKPHIYL